MMTQHTTGAVKPPLAIRLKKELIKYSIVSGYFFISFSMLLLYEATVIGGSHEALPFTMALLKSLVLGKFLLIGEALNAGSLASGQPLLVRVAWKSLAFLVVLIVLKALEELILGWFHDKTVAAIVSEVLDHSWREALAPALIMLLVLIPLISISESYRQLGPAKFRELWLGRTAKSP
jgi:hypothetical protein